MTALCDVADALPRAELAVSLYPTVMMKRIIATLYSYIINFLLRALEWYEESKFSRALHSITKPAALRYDDLIQDIHKTTGKLADLSLASSQAEQRDMHDELRQVHNQQKDLHNRLESMQNQLQSFIALAQQSQETKLLNERTAIKQLEESIFANQNVKSTYIDIRHQLSDMQLTQALTLVSSACTVDHESSYQNSLILRDKHKFRSRFKCAPFWTSQQLHSWNTASSSSLITLKTIFRERLHVRDFCTNIIEQLLKSQTAILWILKNRDTPHSLFEVLKSLIYQALSLDYSSHTDTIFSFQLRKFQAAHSIEDYVNLLGEMLEHFKLIYVIIDADAVSADSVAECRQLLQNMSENLANRGAETIIKVMIVAYTPGSLQRLSKNEVVLRIGRTSQRKSKKLPTEPLQRRQAPVQRRLPTGTRAK